MHEPPVGVHRGPTLVHRDVGIEGTRGPCVVVVTVPVDRLMRTMRVGRTGRGRPGIRLGGLRNALVVTLSAGMFARAWRRLRAAFACARISGLLATSMVGWVGNRRALRRMRRCTRALLCEAGTCRQYAANERHGEKRRLHALIIGARSARLNWRYRPAPAAARPSWVEARCRRLGTWSAAPARRRAT
jgi:hypothetical protein